MTIISFALVSVNFTLLLMLSAMHFYWAFGGKAGFDKAIPTNVEGAQMLQPGKTACIVVALFLAGFALLFLDTIDVIHVAMPGWLHRYSVYGASIIFLFRAIGDFKYVGFTKKITNTEFGSLDTRYYSPLCLLIGLNGVVLEMMLKMSPKI